MHLSTRVALRVAVFAATAITSCSLSILTTASAETLAQALAAAYKNNPAIDAQRARLRATDESVTIAKSGLRPNVTATGNVRWENTQPNAGAAQVIGAGGQLTEGGTTRSAEYAVGLTQSIFTGFQVTNQIRAAEARVRAERAQLRSAEHTLFLQVVEAYVGVLNAKAFISLLEVAVGDASRELKRANDRLALQETTRTDVAQARALRAAASANLAEAQGLLRTARATYVQLVGHEPRNLVPPRLPRGKLPRTLHEAVRIAMREHPLLISALFTEQAARNVVDETRGRLLPQVSVNASYGQEFNTDDTGSDTGEVSATVTVPIYAGGSNHAAVRQAKQLHVAALQAVEAERLRIRRDLTTAWAALNVSKKRLQYQDLRVKANKEAVIGIRKEESVGQRRLNDLFVARRELLASENDLLTSRRDVLVASYRVLVEMGRFNPEDHLPANGAVYDSTVHYEEVNNKWFGLRIVYPNGQREYVNAKKKRR